MTMGKNYLSYIYLLAIFGMTSSGVSIAAQASVATSPNVVLEPAQSIQPSPTVGKNPFSGSVTQVTAAMVLHENQLLSQEINSWSLSRGYKLYWNSKKDYLIYNTISLTGKSDDEILQSLGELFFSENYGLVVKKYEKNHVFVIDEM